MVQLFDYAISNPPYQRLISGATVLNIYPAFIVLGSKIAEKSTMIHPARAFKGAGRVIQEDVDEILDNQHFGIVENFDRGVDVFPSTDIKGGVYITEHIASEIADKPLKNFQAPEITSILNKVLSHSSFTPISSIIYSYNDNKISERVRQEFADEIQDAPDKVHLKTNILTKIPQMFNKEDLTIEYMKELNTDDGFVHKNNCEMMRVNLSGLKLNEKVENKGCDCDCSLFNTDRTVILCYTNGKRQVREVLNNTFVNVDERWIGKWKVFVPAANGAGVMGERISQPFIGSPNMIATQTYVTFGMFDNRDEALNVLRFLKTRFARMLLFTLKVTQQNAKKTWANVPLVNFNNDNGVIDWSVNSLNMIDEQLFEFYGLTSVEKSWLLENIQEQF